VNAHRKLILGTNHLPGLDWPLIRT
jgi:hypothetical protein